MSIFEGIRNRAGEYFLKRLVSESEKREVRTCGLSTAGKIGMLYLADEDKNVMVMKGYIRKLRDAGIKNIMAIGYVDEKAIPAACIPKIDMDFFCRKDLNWYYRPSGMTISNFISENFDVLIDFTFAGMLPVKFVVATSIAGFKVGKYDRHRERLYDMMIDTKEVKSLGYFIEQADTYLSMIRSETKRSGKLDKV